MRVAIVINECLATPSAHMLYIARLAVGLAQARPQASIELLFPGSQAWQGALEEKGLTAPQNLHLHPLPALRKAKSSWGVTLNSVYYHTALWELQALKPDIVFSASFHKMWSWLLNKRQEKSLPATIKFVYELHQLAELDSHTEPKKIREEIELLRRSDTLLTTTIAMKERLAQHGLQATHVPLGCALDPLDYTPKPHLSGPFCLGYIGSTYAGQGIDWLVGHWQPSWGQLHIAGGDFCTPEAKAKGIISYGRLTMPEVKEKILPQVDALVIPALYQGRMPYVAFTKAYDYLAMRRPIIAADLPSIAEVLRDGREAILYQAGDIQSFSAALHTLQGSAPLRTELTTAATARAQELSFDRRIEHMAVELGMG